MAQGFGSRDRPVNLDPFQLIVGVGWAAGGLVVVELTYIIGLTFVRFWSPEDTFPKTDNVAGDIVGPDDYKNEYGYYPMGISVDAGPWLAEQEIIAWVADYRITFPGPNSADYTEEGKTNAINAGHAATGYYPQIDVIGASPVFNLQTIENPNGSRYSYYYGYTAKNPWWFFTDNNGNKDPYHNEDNIMYDYAALDNNGINDWSEVLVWYRQTNRPPVYYEQVKQCWLINFAADKMKIMRIIAAGPGTPGDYVLKGYPTGTFFTFNSDATITAKKADGTIATPSWTASGSAHDGAPHDFSGGGPIVAT